MSSSILSTIQSQLSLYGYSISGVLGTIGNVFIVTILRRQRQNACSVYLISSAITNGVYSIFSTLHQIFPLTYRDGTPNALAVCKISVYILNFLGQIPKTMIILACVDRFMITSDRVTLRPFSTVKRSKWLIFFSIIFWLLFTIYIPIMETIINGQCGKFGIYSTIYTVYAIIFVGSMPPIILGIFGYLTYRNMRKLYVRVQPILHNRIDANNTIQRRDRDLLIIVISEVFVYVITATLYPLILLEMMISRYVISNKSVRYLQIESFILSIAYVLLSINTAIPFYTYLIVSKSFRRDFKKLIIDGCRKLRREPTILPAPRLKQTLTQRDTRV